jgi:hypothetical protein
MKTSNLVSQRNLSKDSQIVNSILRNSYKNLKTETSRKEILRELKNFKPLAMGINKDSIYVVISINDKNNFKKISCFAVVLNQDFKFIKYYTLKFPEDCKFNYFPENQEIEWDKNGNFIFITYHNKLFNLTKFKINYKKHQIEPIGNNRNLFEITKAIEISLLENLVFSPNMYLVKNSNFTYVYENSYPILYPIINTSKCVDYYNIKKKVELFKEDKSNNSTISINLSNEEILKRNIVKSIFHENKIYSLIFDSVSKQYEFLIYNITTQKTKKKSLDRINDEPHYFFMYDNKLYYFVEKNGLQINELKL